jgi:hypothetical protein
MRGKEDCLKGGMYVSRAKMPLGFEGLEYNMEEALRAIRR